MGNMVVIEKPGKIGYRDYEDRALGAYEVRIQMLYSGISAGTQLTLFRGKNPYLNKQFDRSLRLFRDKTSDTSPFPIPGAWAYEEVGRVLETGSSVTKAHCGDIVYGTWGHRTTQIVSEDYCVEHTLPKDLDTVFGIYSQMGAIALNAVLDADIHVGETVAVFGMGVPGQITAQLARLNGADVIAVDMDDFRLDMAKRLGASIVLNAKGCDAALEIKKLTGRGADKAIEIAGASTALHSAIRSCAYNGKVICSGFMTTPASGLVLGEEFHHNRIQIICSQIENVGPHVYHTWNRLRMEQTIMRFCAEGKLDLRSLITHTFAYSEAAKAYDLLDTSTNCLQVVLAF